MGTLKNRDLPKYCYAFHPVTDKPIKVAVGQMGYFPADNVDVEAENELLGVTDEIATLMVAGSMQGWNVLGFKECPKCNMERLYTDDVRNALSRRDNETYICSDCGTTEALEDMENAKA